MSRRGVGEENIRKVAKMGNGVYYITIPIEYIRKLEWRERQKVVVKMEGEKLAVEDWKK